MVNNKCIAFKNKDSIIICNRPAKYKSCLCGYHKKNSNLIIKSELKNFDTFNYNSVLNLTNIGQIYKINKLKKLFCGIVISNFIYKYIIKKHIIFYDYLDTHYNHFLLEGQNSWKDIPIKNIIKLDNNTYHDIVFLINYITSLLNNSNMGQPCPVYPRCPFTRIEYTNENIQLIKNTIANNNIKIDVSLQIFLNSPYKKWYNFIKKKRKTNSTENIKKYFNKFLRFKLINNLDSQNTFVGYWVKKDQHNSIFEELYIEWLKIPPYLLITGELYPNPEKKNFWNILLSCK